MSALKGSSAASRGTLRDASHAAAIRVVSAACLGAVMPGDVRAHAFGARYDLPFPLWLYLVAAGAAVLLSFVVMAVLVKREVVADPQASTVDGANGVRNAWVLFGRVSSVALLLVVVVAAFTGDRSPTGNLAPVFVWVVWWVGFVFLQALVVDLWSVLNPWLALSELLRAFLPASWRAPDGAGRTTYPAALGHWPALAGFIVFAWLEMVSDLGEQPRTLGALIVGYTVLTLTGAVVFGPRAWFARADPFAVVLRIFGGFAPVACKRGGGLPAAPGHRPDVAAPGVPVAGHPGGGAAGHGVIRRLRGNASVARVSGLDRRE